MHCTSSTTHRDHPSPHHNNSTTAEGRQQRAHVVDVLVNPWVVRESLKHRAFQAQVVELALQWAEEEAGLSARPDVPCALVLPAAVCPYWDPEGGEGGRPRLFVLDEERFVSIDDPDSALSRSSITRNSKSTGRHAAAAGAPGAAGAVPTR